MKKKLKNAALQLFKCIKLENELMFKSWWFVLIISTWCGILLVQTFIIMPEHKEVGTSLTLSAYWIQILIVMGLLTGYHGGKREFSNNCDEVISTFPGAYILNRIAKIINAFLVAIIIFLLSIFAICLYFRINNIDSIYYLYSIKYIFLFWVMSFFISTFIGILLGSLIYSKFAYFLIVIIAIAIGPLCMEIIDPLLDQLNISLRPIFMTIETGQIDAHEGMNSLFGYKMQNDLWSVRILILLCLISAFVGILTRYSSNKNRKRIISLSIVFIIIMLSISYNISEKYVKRFYYRYTYDDIEKQYSVGEVKAENNQNNFKILRSSIKIDSNDQLKVNIKLHIKSIKDDNNLKFLLYRGFKVIGVKINGERVGFAQSKDTVKISKQFYINKESDVEMEYIGLPLNYLYQDKNAWMMPADFAWIPKIGDGSVVYRNSYDVKDITFNRGNENSDIEYDITYNGPGNPISNLDTIGKNHWKGKANIGVTFVNGWVKQAAAENGINYYYPVSYKNYSKYVPKMIKDCEENRTKIKEDLDITLGNTENIKSYIFLPNVYPCKDGIYNFGDHYIFSVNETYIDGSFLNYSDVTINWMLQSELLGRVWRNKQNDLWQAFLNSYVTWYNKRYLNKDISNNFSSDNMLLYWAKKYEKHKETKEVAQRYLDLNQYLVTHNDSDVKNFFREWIKMVNDNRNISWNDMKKIMK